MNSIARENQRTDGVMERPQWDIAPQETDPDLVGFASPLSIDGSAPKNSITFKIKSSQLFTLSIFRLGYYQGKGARLIVTLNNGEPYPAQPQPPCCWPSPHSTVDCSNWETTATYTPVANVPSGFYMARLITVAGPHTGKGRLIPFIVRDDSRRSAILFQVSDTTWQAYNLWTDNPQHPPTSTDAIGAFYYPTSYGGVVTHASYNRPFTGSAAFDSSYGFERFYDNTYPAIRWLERIGAHVSYITGQMVAHDYLATKDHPQDSLLLPATPAMKRIFLSVGHDEYWSQEQRNNIERAKNAGVHLIFLSGNQMYWKTGWDGPDTITCEKTSNKIPSVECTQHDFTGRWSDTRYLPSTDPADACGPENATTGTVSAAMSDLDGDILVSPDEGRHRFWRGTSFAKQGSLGLDMHKYRYDTLGHECNFDLDNGYRPAGIMHLSSTPMWGISLNFGIGDYLRGQAASYTHHLTLFRDQTSGALVFHGGAIDFCKALDGFRISPTEQRPIETDPAALALQRGLVNLFADMGIEQPATLPAPTWWTPPATTPSPPSSQIITPSSPIPVNTLMRIEGHASAGADGRIAAVEIATQGEQWHPAIGYEHWHYWWTPPHAGSFHIRSRAVDDRGVIEENISSITVQVEVAAGYCTQPTDFLTLWEETDPADVHAFTDTTEIEVGTHFTASTDGLIYGVRFYRNHLDTKPHHVNLWLLLEAGPTLLTSAAIAGDESIGWIHSPFACTVRTVAGATYITSVRSISGFSYTTNSPQHKDQLKFIQSGYHYANRDKDGFVTPHGSVAGAPLTQPKDISYLIDPLYRPTAAMRYSLWPETGVTPKAIRHSHEKVIEIGTEFSSAVDGFITAVRFFSLDDLPTYTVKLWGDDLDHPLQETSGKGTETDITGWHEVSFATPVPIVAHTRYTVSYHVPIAGTYAATDDYFVLAPVSAWPLYGHRGVSTAGSGKPTQRYKDACYFVDVVFRSSSLTDSQGSA